MVSSLDEILKATSSPSERMDLIDNALRPPEPQLLDTCILQNLDWVDRQLEEKGQVVWDDAALLNLSSDYGVEMANDLVDLGVLYKEFEDRGGYPWLVCGLNSTEASRLGVPEVRGSTTSSVSSGGISKTFPTKPTPACLLAC